MYQWWFVPNRLKLDRPGVYQSSAKLIEKHKRKRQKNVSVLKLPQNYKLMLQLCINGKWKDWVYIARSYRLNARYGLFAARDFPCNTMIGFYMGPVVWESSVEGGYEASAKELKAAGIGDSAYFLQLRNKHCRCVVVDPKPLCLADANEIDQTVLFMGMHFINNPCLDVQKGTREYSNARRQINCLLREDGCVQATRKIGPGTELLTGYFKDQHREKKQVGSNVDTMETVAKKPAAKKSVALKSAAKKSPAKKSPAKKKTPLAKNKSPAKKSPAPAKKPSSSAKEPPPAKKPAAKNSPAKKSPARAKKPAVKVEKPIGKTKKLPK